MGDFSDFLQLGSSQMMNNIEKVNLKNERLRRQKMAEMFNELQSLIPTNDMIGKKTRETTVMDAIEYIKFLEEEKKSLEDLKKMKEMGAKSKPLLLSECSSNRSASSASSVDVSVSNGVAFFGIELPSKRGLVTDIFRVFERYEAEVLAANIGTNDHQFLRLGATVLLENIAGDCIEMIKKDILSL